MTPTQSLEPIEIAVGGDQFTTVEPISNIAVIIDTTVWLDYLRGTRGKAQIIAPKEPVELLVFEVVQGSEKACSASN